MYEQHFGLRELPFSITPDTSYFFGCIKAQEALNTLLIAARNGEGFIKISTLKIHAAKNVISCAVDDSCQFTDAIAAETLLKGLNHRDTTTGSSF